METPSSKNVFTAEKIKKYSPFILLSLLTVLLMFFFKSNKKGISGMIEEGKKNLISLYTGGLRPLISETEISKEDLFNFALYQSLPLDQEKNKVLLISDVEGKMVYEIKPANFNKNTRNYEAFKKYFELNASEKRIADSVLNSYRKDIYSCVLVNEKNAYAVNPKISTVRKAMLADLVFLAQTTNKEKASEVFQNIDDINKNELAALIKTREEVPASQYLLMTPDTIANTDFYWDEKKFTQQIKAFEAGQIVAEEFAKNQAFKWHGDLTPPEVPSTPSQNYSFDYKIDSNKYKISFDPKNLSGMINDSVRINLEKAATQLRSLSVRIPGSKGKGSKSGEIKIIPPIADAIQQIIPDVANVTEDALKIVGSINISKLIEEAAQNDSAFQAMKKDSLKYSKYKEKMRELNKKLKKLNNNNINKLEK